MKLASKFPEVSGWITAKLSLKKGVSFTDEDARQFISFGKPHRIQFGLINASRNPVKIIYRETRRAALDPDSQPIESPMEMDAPVPFVAKCGNLIVEVKEVIAKFAPLQMIRVEILKGKHFNDQGDYGPGDIVTIGPITDHWRILSFPDIAGACPPNPTPP